MFESLTRGEVWVALLTLVGFLASSWWLRGAPFGQSIAEGDGPGELTVRKKDRIAWAASFGLTLVVLGGLVAAAAGVPWSLPVFALGFWLLARSIAKAQVHRHDSPTLRRVAKLGGTALTGSLIAGIAIVANVLAFKYGATPIDFTSSRVHSLSSQSVNQIRGLARPLAFTVFHGQDAGAATRVNLLMQLLDLYRNENPALISVNRMDRYVDRADFEALMRDYPDVGLMPGGGLLIRYGEGKGAEHLVLSSFDLAPTSEGTQSPESQVAYKGEDAITSAIMRMTSDDHPLALVTSGHGELALDIAEPGRPGAALLRSRLESQGFKVQSVNLIGEEIPDRATIVIVARPLQQFQPEEVGKLRAYLQRGGHALFMLDGGSEILQDLLAAYQVRIGKEPVLDPTYCYMRRPNYVLAPISDHPDHPITDPLPGLMILMPGAAKLEIVDAKNPKLAAQSILRTSPASWAESDPTATGPPKRDTGKDEPGPITVGVAVSESETSPGTGSAPKHEPRIVAFSCGLLGENSTLASAPQNQDLILNAIAWLRGKPETMGIPPRTQTFLQITDNPTTLSRILLVPTLLALTTILAAAAVAYRMRRA